MLKLGHDICLQMARDKDAWVTDHDQDFHQPSQFILAEDLSLENTVHKDHLDQFQNLDAEQDRKYSPDKGLRIPLPLPVKEKSQEKARKKDDRAEHKEGYKEWMSGHPIPPPSVSYRRRKKNSPLNERELISHRNLNISFRLYQCDTRALSALPKTDSYRY